MQTIPLLKIGFQRPSEKKDWTNIHPLTGKRQKTKVQMKKNTNSINTAYEFSMLCVLDTILSPFHRCRKWDSENFDDMPKAI